MKIRNGFVSNSSSSSFIIGLPDKVENLGIAGLKELMGECGAYIKEYNHSTDRVIRAHISSDEVVQRVYDDMIEVGEASDADIRSEIQELSYMKFPDKEYEEIKSSGKFHYIVNYEDRGFEYPFHEGEVFFNLPTTRISYH